MTNASTSFAAVAFLLFILCSTGLGVDNTLEVNDDMLIPVKVLALSRLKKEIRLANDANVYLTVAKLFDQAQAIDSKKDGMTSKDLNLAWASNPEADKQKLSLALSKGSTVLDAIREIAKARAEMLIISENNVIIMPDVKNANGVDAGKKQAPSVGEQMFKLVISASLMIREPDGDGLESLINDRFRYAWQASNNTGAPPYYVRMSNDAKQRTGAVNVIGYWTYTELFDAIGLIASLSWRTDGKMVIFEVK